MDEALMALAMEARYAEQCRTRRAYNFTVHSRVTFAAWWPTMCKEWNERAAAELEPPEARWENRMFFADKR